MTVTPRMRWLGALAVFLVGAILLGAHMIAGECGAVEVVLLALLSGGAAGLGVEMRR